MKRFLATLASIICSGVLVICIGKGIELVMPPEESQRRSAEPTPILMPNGIIRPEIPGYTPPPPPEKENEYVLAVEEEYLAKMKEHGYGEYYPVQIECSSAYIEGPDIYCQFLNYYDFQVSLYTDNKYGELKKQVIIDIPIEDAEFAKVVVASVLSSYKGYLSYDEAYEIARIGLEKGRLPDYTDKEYRIKYYNKDYPQYPTSYQPLYPKCHP